MSERQESCDCFSSRRWLTTKEAAWCLQVAPEKIQEWVRSGALRAANITQQPGGRPRWRIDPRDLEAFVQGRQPDPPAPRTRRRRRRQHANGDAFVEYY